MLNDKKADDFNAKCERSIIKILRLLVDKCIINIGNFYSYHVLSQFYFFNKITLNLALNISTFISGPALAMAAIVLAPSVLIILAYLATCKKGVSVTSCQISNTGEDNRTSDLIVDSTVQIYREGTYLDLCEFLQLVNFSIIHRFAVSKIAGSKLNKFT